MMDAYRFMPEFSPDEAAALWCEIEPDAQDAENFYECAFRALYDADYRRAMLASATPEKNRYCTIFRMIHGAMATTNDCPQRKDKITRQELIRIAGELKEHPGFLFPDDGLVVFKSMKLTASEVTVRLLRKDEKSQPDRVAIEAREKKRTVTCSELGLINKNTGLLNREGQMLVALEKGTVPRNIKAPEQAMTELRKIFREIIGTKADPFHPKKMDWKPRFKLVDAQEQASKRAADRAIHVKFDALKPEEKETAGLRHQSPEDKLIEREQLDEAGKWLQENDK